MSTKRTNSRRCWENKKSKRHDKREYFVNTESGVSQWGRQDKNDPLPAGWEYCISTNGETFYYNLHSELAQWKKPTEAEKLPVPEGFEEKRTKKCKNVYYVNLETGKTQWEYPEEKETRGNEDSHFELIEDEDSIGTVFRLKKPISGSDSESGSDDSFSNPDLDRRTKRVLKTQGSKNVGRETSSDEDEKWYDEYEDETRFGAGKKFIRKGIKNKANQKRTPKRNHKKEMQKIKRLKNKLAKKEDEVVKQELIRHDSEDSLTDQSVDQKDLKEDEDLYKRMEKDLDDKRRNFQEDIKDKDMLSQIRGSQDVGFGGFGGFGDKNLARYRTYQDDLNHEDIQSVDLHREIDEGLDDGFDDFVEQELVRHDSEDSLTDQSVNQDEINRMYQIYNKNRTDQEDLQEDEDQYNEMQKVLDDERIPMAIPIGTPIPPPPYSEFDPADPRGPPPPYSEFDPADPRGPPPPYSEVDPYEAIPTMYPPEKRLKLKLDIRQDLQDKDRLTQTRGSQDVRRETRFGAGKKFLDKELKGKAIQKRSLRNHKKEMHLRDKNKKLSRLISLMNEERDKDTEAYQELRNIIQETREEISRLKKQIDTNEESSEDDFFDADEEPKHRLLAKQLIKEDRSTPIVDQYREIQPIVKDEIGIGLPYSRQDHRSLSRESLEKHRKQENRRHSHRDEQYIGQFFDKISNPLSPDDDVDVDVDFQDTPLSPSESGEEPENFHDAPMFNFNQSKTIANDEDDDDFKDSYDFDPTKRNETFGEYSEYFDGSGSKIPYQRPHHPTLSKRNQTRHRNNVNRLNVHPYR
jgi:hypothetical protein